MRRVPSIALPSPASLRLRPDSHPAPLDRPGVSFWYSGRVAIYQGVRILGLERGDRVLVPAYSCGSELDALLKSGLEVECYRHRQDLTPDLDHVNDLCRRPARVLYVTHYFGIAQPIGALRDFAREHGLVLLEDCAHALYSGDASGTPLGVAGDVAIFSFTKALPLPDGGALVVNGGDGRMPATAPTRPEFLAVAGKVRHLVECAVARCLPGLAREVRARVTGPAVDWLKSRCRGTVGAGFVENGSGRMDPMLLHPGRVEWGMSALGLELFRRLPHASIRDRRRRNFARLADACESSSRVQPLFRTLPDHACPWTFPILVDEPEAFYRFCLGRGVQTTPTWRDFHPAVPLSAFPFESHLKRTVVSLPVHQDLDERDVAVIAGLVHEWAGGGRERMAGRS